MLQMVEIDSALKPWWIENFLNCEIWVTWEISEAQPNFNLANKNYCLFHSYIYTFCHLYAFFGQYFGYDHWLTVRQQIWFQQPFFF